MANVQHSTLSTSNLHEPKGVSTASNNKLYLADGSGSGDWQTLLYMGGIKYNAIGTGRTFTTPTAYALMDVPTTPTHLNGMTNNSLGRLTYTGAESRHSHAVCDMSFKHSTGAGNDVFITVYKNGSQLVHGGVASEVVSTTDSGNYQHIAIHFDAVMVTNDYFEVYLKTSTGNIIVHQSYMFIMGMPL